MNLKLRLALAFFLLSAVPLSGIAVYSYVTSRAALREAAKLEAELLAREMEARVANAASGVGRRLDRLRDVPMGAWGAVAGDSAAPEEWPNGIVASLAEAAPYFEDLQFVPSPPSAANGSASPPEASAPTEPATDAPPVASLPTLPRVRLKAHRAVTEEELRQELERVRAAVSRTLAETARARIKAERLNADPRTRAELRAAELETAQELAHLSQRIAGTPTRSIEPGHPTDATHPAVPAIPAPVRSATATPTAGEQVLKGRFSCPIEENGKVVGTVTARIRARELLGAVLAETRTDQGEIPFAIDSGDQLYVATSEHAGRLRELPGLQQVAPAAGGARATDDWVVVTRRDPASGLRYGIARPLSEALAALRRATVRNLGFGMALVGLALVGIFPLAGRMTRNLATLEGGASRLASGDLEARVPVRSRDEFGRLAGTFNHMAEQLCVNQKKLLEQEQLRKEEEIARRLLAAENERKSRELEEARQFQLSLLPKELPAVAGLELAVSMHTATEVGGDYYDGQQLEGGEVVLAVGDATGHGAASATMVTVVKSLFICEAGSAAPAVFLARANAQIQRMALGRMAMALSVLRLRGRRLQLSAAGMPPALWHRAATGEVVEVALSGLPLGALAGAAYQEVELELAPGDDLLLMSDGFPELQSPAGEPLGYDAARAHFAVAASHATSAEEMLAELRRAADQWTAGGAPSDDLTFLLVRAV